MQKLAAQFSEIEKVILSHKVLVPDVSIATVGWHLHHVMIVADSVVEALENSDPKKFNPKFSIWKYAVLWTKKIPRGKGKAPKKTLPIAEMNEKQLLFLLNSCKEKIEKLSSMPKNKYFPHPYFGDLSLKQAIPFLQTHTEHHLKIIRDILKRTN